MSDPLAENECLEDLSKLLMDLGVNDKESKRSNALLSVETIRRGGTGGEIVGALGRGTVSRVGTRC